MSKRLWALIAVLILIFVGVTVMKNNKTNAPSASNQPTSHIEGSTSTGVSLLEYGDYECPYCGNYFSIVKQVAAQYNDKITFQFRNLPLSQVHPNAFAAARAAEAASLQGKFWQMHDLLYETQSAWVSSSAPISMFDTYAKQLGLNITQFDRDFASSKVNDAINADMNAFAKTGDVTETPTFYLDGKKIQPGPNVSDFTSLIDAAIASKAQK